MSADRSEFHLSDNEQIVRDYECTKGLTLLGSAVIGYLTITNKRIVFHSQVRNFTGMSALLSEVALDDFSGLSTSISTSFNWILFFIFYGIMYAITFFTFSISSMLQLGWFISILLITPYLVAMLLERDILSHEFKHKLFSYFNQVPGAEYLERRTGTYYMGIFRIFFWLGVALIAWSIVQATGLAQFSIIALLILGVVYYYIYRAVFGRVKSFKLSISSRSPKNAGITIPGNPLSLILGGGAVQSLYSGPGRDAERIVRELGALLTDIRQMGDLGIEKWTGRSEGLL